MAFSLGKGIIEIGGTVGASLRGMGGKISGIMGGMGKALPLIGGALAIGKLAGTLMDTATAMDAVAKSSHKLGMTTEALSRLQYVGELSGVAANTMTMALQRMTRRIAEAALGIGEAQAALKELGLDAQALAMLSPNEAFFEIADAMAGVRNQANKVRLAFKLFDSEGVALVNTLAMGRRGLEEAAAASDMLGNTITAEEAKAAEDFADALTDAKAAWTGLWQNVVYTSGSVIKAWQDYINVELGRKGVMDPEVEKSWEATNKKWEKIQRDRQLKESIEAELVAKEEKKKEDARKTREAKQKQERERDEMTWRALKMQTQEELLRIEETRAQTLRRQMHEAGAPEREIRYALEDLQALERATELAEKEASEKQAQERDAQRLADAKKKQAEAHVDVIAALREELALVGKTANETQIYKLQTEGATAALVSEAKALQGMITARGGFLEASKALTGYMKQTESRGPGFVGIQAAWKNVTTSAGDPTLKALHEQLAQSKEQLDMARKQLKSTKRIDTNISLIASKKPIATVSS